MKNEKEWKKKKADKIVPAWYRNDRGGILPLFPCLTQLHKRTLLELQTDNKETNPT